VGTRDLAGDRQAEAGAAVGPLPLTGSGSVISTTGRS